jgi:outer membrane protein assembly factor BamB
MSNLRLRVFLTGLVVLVVAADWPQWRGPDRSDVSLEKGLLGAWPPGGPRLLWTFTDAGAAMSGPAIVGDRLYTMGADHDHDSVFAIDLNSRKKVWSTPLARRYTNDWGDGPRGTPTVDGDRIYALTGGGTLACLQSATGKKIWHVDLRRDLGGDMMSGWGYSESPLVDGDRVICTPGGTKGAVAALDKRTGKVIWRNKGFTDRAAYSSLVVATVGGIRQYVQMTGESVAGIAANDGRLLWRMERSSPTAAIPTPIVKDNLVYFTSGYGTGCTLIELAAAGNSITARQVYANRNLVNQHGGAILVGDHVYGYHDNGQWVCQDLKTGKVAWRSNKLGKGSVTCADGHLYCYSEDEGTVVLVEASPAGWNEKGRFTIPQETKLPRKQGRIWTHPVIANGKLYLRDQDLIFCYDVKDRTAAR